MGRLNPAVMRGLDVLEHLAETAQPPTLRDLAGTLGLPRTTTFEVLNTLVYRGYIVKSAREPTRYSLGTRVFELGGAFADRLDYVALGQEAATKLSEASRETAHVAILDGTDVVYIAIAESPQPVRMVSSLGSRVAAHCTSVGKALLAELSDAELERRLPAEQPLAELTPNTITSPTALRKELALVRSRAYAIEECEANIDVCGAAATIRDHTGNTIAAISVSVPQNRWAGHPRAYWTAMVSQAAQVYSESLGYRPTARRTTTS